MFWGSKCVNVQTMQSVKYMQFPHAHDDPVESVYIMGKRK